MTVLGTFVDLVTLFMTVEIYFGLKEKMERDIPHCDVLHANLPFSVSVIVVEDMPH